MAPQILTSIYPPLPKASYSNIFDYVSSESESSLADKVQFVRQDGKQFTVSDCESRGSMTGTMGTGVRGD
ncbi:hypothetical protein PaG_03374 [Moesziomyces aphidis]|uniref:Uncharacterized protein n=2 Tax=Moesziomyces TaxID=63261 RepID=M9MFI9_PSEA3|nr:hypothetical protein PaG_03374 [Moesziomyces aphidis]GAC74372.1 hypothetical protein PANT_11c00028 [Moesziomyces antarcticus T-34]